MKSISLSVFACCLFSVAVAHALEVPLEPGECWYGAATAFGRDVPFGTEATVTLGEKCEVAGSGRHTFGF